MLFQIGEKVGFLNEKGGGIIVKIVGQSIYVEDESGFDRPFKANELVKIHSTQFDVPESIEKLAEASGKKLSIAPEKSSHIRIFKDYWEIDLHLEDLIEHFGNKISINKDESLYKQMSVFKDFYQKARTKKVKKLIIIHGYGKGILRDELHVFLKGQDGVEFFDAPYVEYGHGATQVEIKYNY
jgi:hypothetical protein